jgi:hypothetical protein
MQEIERIGVGEARRHAAQQGALLVCGYEDDDKCRALRLNGALTMSEFRARAGAMPRDQEVIFYCA